MFCTASRSTIGVRVTVGFTPHGEFHASTCMKKLTIPENMNRDDIASTLRVITGRGKGKGKGKGKANKSFTVV